MRTHKLGAIALALTLGGVAFASAQLSPSHIGLDEAATLRVEADAGSAPTPPAVDGLRFQRAGQSTEMTIINGAVTQHTFVDYQVVAAHAGVYTIPVNGQRLQLEVGGGRASSLAPTAAPESSASEGSLAFMRVALPAHKVYVGQSVPITFKAYFRAGTEVTLTAAPSLGIPAFTISQLSEQPRQSVETVGGVPYRVATWTGEVTAAMPGHYASNATLPLVARYREASRSPEVDPFAGMLDDQDPASLMRSFMSHSAFGGDLFGQVRERQMTLHAHVQPIDVAALPIAGQPADFSGAVGHFDIHANLASTTGATFEPISLKVEISGRGNFDRVATSGVRASSEWKTYPPGAGTMANASKVFEQAVVPQVAGRIELPPVSFSFFDPDRGQYVTRSTSPIPVQVAKTATPSVAARTAAPVETATALRPNRDDEGANVGTLAPPYERPLFGVALALPLLGLAFLSWRSRERVVSARARRRARNDAISAQRAEMKRAASGNDVTRYFHAARTAVQMQLGHRWHLAAEDVTAAEIGSRMGAAGAPFVSVVETAEHLLYAGVPFDIGSLAHYDALLEQRLDALEVGT